MNRKKPFDRREFLRAAIAGTLGASSMATTMASFAGASNLARSNNKGFSDYRALVCVYLYGGNDSFNMIVPRDASRFADYEASRGSSLALPHESLLPITDAMQGEFGFHGACSGLQTLYQQNRLAVIANTGTLVQPTTRQDYLNQVGLPRHLFSHNSQQDQTMTALPQQPSRTGWSGRLAEILHPVANGNATAPLNISISGDNLLQVGASSTPVIVGSRGTPTFDICQLDDGSSRCADALSGLLDQALVATHSLRRGHARIYNRSHQLSTLIDSALGSAVTVDPSLYPDVPADFPGNPDLGLQLQTVTRLISVAQQLEHQRSVFFVSLGGWDTHDAQLGNHELLLSNLSANLSAFYQQLSDLGFADQVLTFTGSDFGRTLTSNGDGSDHGWGGNQIVMGSETLLQGGQMYGTFPDLALGSADDADLGRIIPTTPLDTMHATLARWLGVSDSDMLDLFPNLANFGGAQSDLGFLI